MKGIKKYFRTKFNNWIISHFVRLKPANVITDLYRDQATEDLSLTARIVNVKKGKIRYLLMVVMNKDMKVKFNIGRL